MRLVLVEKQTNKQNKQNETGHSTFISKITEISELSKYQVICTHSQRRKGEGGYVRLFNCKPQLKFFFFIIYIKLLESD